MTKNFITALSIFILLSVSLFNCTKHSIKSDESQEILSLSYSKDSVLNFIPNNKASSSGLRSKSSERAITNGTADDTRTAETSSARSTVCGGSFSNSYAGSGYYTYPIDTINLTNTVEGSSINASLTAYDVPNRFTIYDATGTVVASSPWMGYATYSGPWGMSLNSPTNGTLYFTKSGSGIYTMRVETSVSGTSDSYNVSIGCTAPSSVTRSFAGVTLTYYQSTGLIRFNSEPDLSRVLDTLDANYETYNANYESQYSSFTPNQLDSVDAITNFDEFYTMRQFEGLFPSYTSKRSQLEGIESTWLTNNMTGIDPDSVDQTFDDAENVVSNTNNKLIVGTTTYIFGDAGTNDVGSRVASTTSMRTAGPASTLSSLPCFTNRRKHVFYTLPDDSRKFKLKVAINSWWVRSGAKGKVVSYKKQSNGKFKRSRMKLAVGCTGTIYDNHCIQSFTIGDRNPSPSGYKNRKSLKIARHQPGIIWKTENNELGSSFDALNVATGTLVLQ